MVPRTLAKRQASAYYRDMERPLPQYAYRIDIPGKYCIVRNPMQLAVQVDYCLMGIDDSRPLGEQSVPAVELKDIRLSLVPAENDRPKWIAL